MNAIKFILMLWTLFRINPSAQQLSQIKITSKGELSKQEIINNGFEDTIGKLSAGILIMSNIEGLLFSSKHGIIKIKNYPGKYLIYVSPKEKEITISCRSYKTIKISLRKYGIQIKAGAIWKILVTEAAPPVVAKVSFEQQNTIKTSISIQDTLPAKVETKKVEENPLYFLAVEEMPELIGGIQAVQNKIIYPEIAKRAGVEGRVFIKAFIDEEGNVNKTEVIKGIGAGCDEAAETAVIASKFKPAKQRGRYVKVQVSVPILFKLQ